MISEVAKNVRKKQNPVSENENLVSGKERPMYDATTQLNKDHAMRQIQRIKTRGPIALVTALIVVGTIIAGISQVRADKKSTALVIFIAGGILAALWSLSAHLLAEWDKALVLRLGTF